MRDSQKYQTICTFTHGKLVIEWFRRKKKSKKKIEKSCIRTCIEARGGVGDVVGHGGLGELLEWQERVAGREFGMSRH